jgi:hypothetical protein
MFIGQIGQAKKHKVSPYVPRPRQIPEEHRVIMFLYPAEEHKYPICESRPFFILPRSSASRCLLPMHRPPQLCPGHARLATPRPTPTRPRLALAALRLPRSRPDWPRAPAPSRPTKQRGSVVSPAPPSSARRPPGPVPATPRPAPRAGRRPSLTQQRLPVALPWPCLAWQRASTARPGPSHRRPVPASAYSSSESRAPLYINFFLIKINEFMRHAKNTMNR